MKHDKSNSFKFNISPHYWLDYSKFKAVINYKRLVIEEDIKTLYQQELDYKEQCDKVSKLKAKQSFIRNKKKRKSKTKHHD